MLRVRHSPGDPCCISASAAELKAIAGRLRVFAENSDSKLAFDCEQSGDAKPYSSFIKQLVFHKNKGKDRFSLFDMILLYQAEKEGFLRLASFFDFPDNAAFGHHAHHEYYPGNECISADSEPAVIVVEN